MYLLCTWLHILQTAIFNFWDFIPITMLFYDSTVNLNQNYVIFKLWSDLDTFELHLYSCPHQPDDSHKGGQNMLVTAIKLHPWNQNTFVGHLICCIRLINVQNMKHIRLISVNHHITVISICTTSVRLKHSIFLQIRLFVFVWFWK
jgi:hypothetical protein